MLTSLNVIDSEEVIREVRKHPCIYDITSEEHRNKQARSEAWLSVFQSLAGTAWDQISLTEQILFGKEVQKRWKSLKDAFARTVKCQEVREGVLLNKKPYVYHKHLTFMLPIMNGRARPNGPLVSDSLPSSSNEIPLRGNDADVEDSSRNESSAGTSDDPPYRLRPAALVRGWERAKSPTRKKQRLLCEDEVNQEISSTDPDLMFFYSLIPQVRKLKSSEKIRFQMEVMSSLRNYVDSAELKEKLAMLDSFEDEKAIHKRIFEECGIKLEPPSP